jgi:phosphoglycolate phosphatase
MKTIYFDLDGTLTDPKVGITRSIQYALEKLGRVAPPEEDLTWCIGPPLRGSLLKLLGDDHLADRAVSFYRERFSDIGIYENGVYAGIEDTLSLLTGRGRRLFVATSKPRIYAERIIDHFNLGSYFDCVFGSELDGTRSDKTELLKYALEAGRIDPTDAVMVGDRSHDIVGARNNRMRALGVLYGYGSKDELIQAGAHHVCATPQEVPDHTAPSATQQLLSKDGDMA